MRSSGEFKFNFSLGSKNKDIFLRAITLLSMMTDNQGEEEDDLSAQKGYDSNEEACMAFQDN